MKIIITTVLSLLPIQIDDLQHKLKKSLARTKESEETMERVRARTSTTTLDTEAKMIQMQSDHLNMCNKLRQVRCTDLLIVFTVSVFVFCLFGQAED